ncbi:MAG: 16S rRNA (guanine(527)-N(7))-methyltransferase RsmG [Pseudomonadota bacterium]
MRDLLEDVCGRSVSRETYDKLKAFEGLVRKWTKTINLVSKSSTKDLWARHILDSAQLLRYAQPTEGAWVDLGTGGGFPGIVVAILLEEDPRPFYLVESDTRKAAFLLNAVQNLNLSAQILPERIENYSGPRAATLSARALAPLHALLDLSAPITEVGGEMLFLKGRSWREELTAAQQSWTLKFESHTSRTNAESAVLRIERWTRA